jgi:hypothetical protein
VLLVVVPGKEKHQPLLDLAEGHARITFGIVFTLFAWTGEG